MRPSIDSVRLLGIQFQFFNYSPSQIKQKSWWMSTVNAIEPAARQLLEEEKKDEEEALSQAAAKSAEAAEESKADGSQARDESPPATE